MLDESSSMALIQIQDQSGVWRTVFAVVNNSQNIIQGMTQAQHMYPNKRIRTIDSIKGNIIDIL